MSLYLVYLANCSGVDKSKTNVSSIYNDRESKCGKVFKRGEREQINTYTNEI
jgi:hypothetical protein